MITTHPKSLEQSIIYHYAASVKDYNEAIADGDTTWINIAKGEINSLARVLSETGYSVFFNGVLVPGTVTSGTPAITDLRVSGPNINSGRYLYSGEPQ